MKKIRHLFDRFKKLTLWTKIAIWGSFASIISLVFYLVMLIPKSTTLQPPTLRTEEIRLRFGVVSYSITDKHLRKAPTLLHCGGKLGLVSIEFDLCIIPKIIYGTSRGAPMPTIWYESEHITIRNLALLNERGINGAKFQFLVPMELRGLVGQSTHFQAELFILGKWYPTGIDAFEGGIIEIQIDKSPINT
jgi:hypothetical protein